MPQVKPLTADALAPSTGTIDIDSGYFGGFDLYADGTNVAELIIRENDAAGTILVKTKTLFGKFPIIPMRVNTIYYSLTGLNSSVMLYDYVK